MELTWKPITEAPKRAAVLVFGLLEGETESGIYMAEPFIGQDGRPGRFIIERGGEDYDVGYATHFMFLPDPPNTEG